MVVDQVHIDGFAVDEAKDDPPIGGNAHTPITTHVAGHWMQAITGPVQVAGLPRRIQVGQHAADAPEMLGIQQTSVVALVQSPQSLVPLCASLMSEFSHDT